MAAIKKNVNGSNGASRASVMAELDLLTDVEADFRWNARSAQDGDSTDEKGNGSRGWIGTAVSIALEGQKVPVVVRPNPSTKKNAKPYALVSGFTRYRAIAAIAAGDPEVVAALKSPEFGAMGDKEVAALKTKNPTIRAFVREMDEFEARKENLSENVNRDSLSGPDLAVGVMRLYEANPKMSHEKLAATLGKNQPYVSRVLRIAKTTSMTVLPGGWNGKDSPATNILEAWRIDPIKLTIDQMLRISEQDDPQKQIDMYLAKRKVNGGKKGDAQGAGESEQGVNGVRFKGPGAWIKNAVQFDVPKMAIVLATLEKMGHLTLVNPRLETPAMEVFLELFHGIPAKATEDQLNELQEAIEESLLSAQAGDLSVAGTEHESDVEEISEEDAKAAKSARIAAKKAAKAAQADSEANGAATA